MSDHWEPPSPLDGELEPAVRASYDARAPVYSIAVSLKRIADKLAADAQAEPPAPAPVDLSQLRPGDAIRFASGRIWLVREVGPLDDGYYVTAVDAWIDRLHDARFSRMGHPTGGDFGPQLVEIIKGDRYE